jgi:chromatin remodeling complex protein RSC6
MGKTSGKGSALKKEMKCSEELQAVVKEKKISRGNLMKAIWKYISKHKLKSEDDGRIIKVADSKLEPLFKSKLIADKRKIEMRGKTIKIPKGHVFMTEIAGALSKHLS